MANEASIRNTIPDGQFLISVPDYFSCIANDENWECVKGLNDWVARETVLLVLTEEQS